VAHRLFENPQAIQSEILTSGRSVPNTFAFVAAVSREVPSRGGHIASVFCLPVSLIL